MVRGIVVHSTHQPIGVHMKRVLVSIALCLSLFAVVSCKRNAAPAPGGVAVIDLDKVAGALGWLNELNANLQSTDASLQAQLNQILQNGIKSVEDAKKEIITQAKLTADQVKQLNEVRDVRELEKLPLTADQRQKLIDTLNRANVNLQVARNQYQQLMTGRRAELIAAYREKIRPVARRVANNRGMSVVLTVTDPVLYSDPATSITEDVIEEMMKTYGKSSPAPAPAPAPAPTPAPAPAK